MKAQIFETVALDLHDVAAVAELEQLDGGAWEALLALLKNVCVVQKPKPQIRGVPKSPRLSVFARMLVRQDVLCSDAPSAARLMRAAEALAALSAPHRAAYVKCGGAVADLLAPALQAARHVLVVDPYIFSTRQAPALQKLVEFACAHRLDTLELRGRWSPQGGRFCVMGSAGRPTKSLQEAADAVRDSVQAVLPVGRRLQLVVGLRRWGKEEQEQARQPTVEDPHDRFLLFCPPGRGVDQGYVVTLGRGVQAFRDSADQTVVALLPRDTARLREDLSFDHTDQYTLGG